MSARSFFRGLIWSLIALVVVGHVAGGWYFSNELIEDGFVPSLEAGEAVGHPEAVDVAYDTPLGSMDAVYIPASGSTWVIHVHGKGSAVSQMEYLFAPINEAGFPQLSINYRNDFGQPLDSTGYYRYGVSEWEDIEGAVEFAEANGADSLIFSGFSTGASHILSFVYRNNLDEIKGLIFDAPNIDMGDTVDYGAGQRDLPLIPAKVPITLTWVAKFITSLRIDVNWKSIDYVSKAESSLRVPTLVQHTTGDDKVPVTQSIRFAETQSALVRLVQYESDAHHGSYDADPEKYISEVLSFLQENG
ncbi:MAG: alpha/beta hydrolase [Actinomycetota bacterium]|nr:alpha/beta hydrolase [Actinomycetota bacterium]